MIHEKTASNSITSTSTTAEGDTIRTTNEIDAFLYNEHVFPTHTQCCLTFTWIKL